MKNSMYLAAEAKRTLGKHGFLLLFGNVFKNNITSSVRHIIVCLFKTEERMNRTFVQCDDTPASGTTLLLRRQERLCSVRRHSC